MTTKTSALIIGLIFTAVGLLGFIDNPIVGTSEKAIFHADTMHNLVHIGSAILFFLFALAAPSSTATFMVVFGIIYLAIGVLGLISFGTQGMGKVLGILYVNGADNILHVVLGVVIFIAGIASRKTVRVA
jgi:hypothetical protein